MHQLDLYGYQQKEAQTDITNLPEEPAFWHLYKGKVNEKTKEKIKGSSIRVNGSKTEIIGLLLKGSKIKLGDEIKRYEEGEKKKRISRGWYKLESLDSGCIVTEREVHYQLGSLSGYVYKDDLNETIELDNTAHKEKLYSIKKEGNDEVGANKKKVPGIIVYDQPNSETILSYLPTGISFEFDGDDNGYAKITQIQGNYIPSPLIITEAAQGDPTHKGWVKISNLSSLRYKPKALDTVVVLDKPIPIAAGDFIGYLGHSVSRKKPYYQYDSPLPRTARPNDNELNAVSAQLSHIELFTGDDLPSYITKTRALADKLPESEKSLIIVEQGAQLIIENLADGLLPQGLQIQATTPHNQSYYIQVKTSYILTLNRNQVFRDNIISANPLSTESSIVAYRLTADDKSALVYRYQFQYPELTEAAIPNQVELIGYHDYSDNNRLLLSNLVLHSNDDQIKIRFSKVNSSSYWIKAMDIIPLQGDAGQITQPISYWNAFPLSLNNLPIASIYNTVHYTRTLPLSSISESNQIAIDKQFNSWIYITAGNIEGSPIKGWVNMSKGETDYLQPHIKRASPWEWIGFNTVTETANVANLVEKIQTNRKMTLDLADYTESMSALHHILTETPISQQLPYVLPPFTEKQLKEGLRTPWTAEQIGHLAVKYESEWYADESLSKWNEIDDFYEKERQAKQKAIQKELKDKPAAVEYALEVLTEKFKSHINEWNIEKNQRIKPSLWWNEVVTAQQAQTESTTTPVLSKLPADGKVWHLHPVGMKEFNIPFGITVKMLKQIFTSVPQSRQDLLQFMVDDINAHMDEYKLDTPLRLSHFFAQVKQEVGVTLKIVEDFTYSVSSLKITYEYFNNNPTEAETYGYSDNGIKFVSQDNQRFIANKAMGSRKSLGNLGANTDDGWNFRGRGLKQLTGRANYTDFNDGYPTIWNDEIVNVVNDPDLLHTNYKYIVRSGIYFWLKNELYLKADLGNTEDVVNMITEKINKFTNSKQDRYNNFKDIYHDKKIFDHL